MDVRDLLRRGIQPDAAEWAVASVTKWHWRVLRWAIRDYRHRRAIGKLASFCRSIDRRLWMAGIRL